MSQTAKIFVIFTLRLNKGGNSNMRKFVFSFPTTIREDYGSSRKWINSLPDSVLNSSHLSRYSIHASQQPTTTFSVFNMRQIIFKKGKEINGIRRLEHILGCYLLDLDCFQINKGIFLSTKSDIVYLFIRRRTKWSKLFETITEEQKKWKWFIGLNI